MQYRVLSGSLIVAREEYKKDTLAQLHEIPFTND